MNGVAPRYPLRRVGIRRLTAEEEQLWTLVARTAKPLRPLALAAPHRRSAAEPAHSVRQNPAENHTLPVSRPRAPQPALAIGRREKLDVARGRIGIDDRLDLHGMTQAEAYRALLHFVRRCQAGGAKFVLVITGKGAPNASPGTRGVLRRQVPLWLELPEFRNSVLGFDAAHLGHGGDGALYVRLRRLRG